VTYKNFILNISLLICAYSNPLSGQSGCITEVGAFYGSPTGNERAKSILPTQANDGLYAVGMKEDSTLILKINLEGVIIWSHTFDIVPDEIDNVTTAILDVEGMIVTVGIAGDYSDGGSAFAFRYNPITNQVLWAKEYISSTNRTYAFAVVQKPNGNYVLGLNPHPPLPATTNDDEMVEVTKASGTVVGGLDKVFNLGGSDAMSELIFYQNFMYGTGRYTDGLPNSKMRHTIIKFDPTTYSQVWVKMGHVASGGTARLYGKDILIDQDQIFTIYQGDPVGTSTTNTKVYVQKTDLNGNLVWLKQYELPGNNDVCHQFIKLSTGGFAILAGMNAAPSQIAVLKIDDAGALIWSKQFQYPSFISSIFVERGNNQIQEVAGNIYVTATGVNTNGTTDLMILRLDQNGITDMPCVTTSSATVTVTTISATTFYNVVPFVSNGNPTVISESPPIYTPPFPYRSECVVSDTLMQIVNTSICLGDSYEGYSSPGTYSDYFLTSNGCDSLRILNLGQYPNPTTTEQASICFGDSYNGYTMSGTYSATYQSYQGCDSTHILTLTVIPNTLNVNAVICDGQDYNGYTVSGNYVDTIQGVNTNCDTIRFLSLTVLPPIQTFFAATICNGEMYEGYTSSGTYTDEFTNASGCDSIRTLDLEVLDDDFIVEDEVICLGESYQGQNTSGTYTTIGQNVFGCDSTHILNLDVIPLEVDLSIDLCEGEEYDGYSSSGLYTDTLQGPPNGCDTIRYLDLTVHTESETMLDITICDGDTYEGYNVAGQYTDVFTSQFGCDSTRILQLEVVDQILTEIEVTICAGQSYEGYSIPGDYTDQFISSFGCDSIRLLHLMPGLSMMSLDVSICEGESFEIYMVTGQYIDTLPGLAGDCDTIRLLNLVANPLNQILIHKTICTGDSYLGHSNTGMYLDTISAIIGCDTLRTLDLEVLDQILSNESITICSGQSYQGHFAQGIYMDTLQSQFGCDSVRIINLAVVYEVNTIMVNLCSGGSYQGYTQAGTYIDTIAGTPGNCDTIQNLTIVIVPPLLTYINASICDGQTFLGYGVTGMYSDTFQAVDGCDSVRMLMLTVDEQIETFDSKVICQGEVYEGYSLPAMYVDTFVSVGGCDSIRHLNLQINTPVLFQNVTICNGDNYLGHSQTGTYMEIVPGNGNDCDTSLTLQLIVLPAISNIISANICEGQNFEGYTTMGMYVDTFQTASGCDSIRTLNLSVQVVIQSTLDVSICDGQSFEGYTVMGMYVDTFQTALGCDSIRILNLSSGDVIQSALDISICTGNFFEGHGQSGIYQDTFISAGGCDSIRRLNLTVFPAALARIDQVICHGEAFMGHSETGVYMDTLTTNAGCDSINELHLEKLDEISSSFSFGLCDGESPYHLPPGQYADTLISFRGCDSIVSISIGDATLYIPNVFSPNQDGINDEFTLFPYPQTSMDIEYFAIFDRFGDMAYETTKWPIIWKGDDRKGHLFQPAVFAYVLIYNCSDERIVKHGNITLSK